MAADWTDAQNDATVADYFAMLADDIAKRPYKKAEHNHLLQKAIGRQRGAIEYKHQNISAVLKGLGEDWIPGYKPAFNFQASLVDAVVRWLDRHPDWLTPAARVGVKATPSELREASALWIGPPPTHSNAPPPDELEQMTAIAANTMSPNATRAIARLDMPARSACWRMSAPTMTALLKNARWLFVLHAVSPVVSLARSCAELSRLAQLLKISTVRWSGCKALSTSWASRMAPGAKAPA